MKYSGFLLVIIGLIVGLAFFSIYTVDETEQVVITRLGKVVGEGIKTPGLKFKLPIDFVNRFPKTLLEWDGERGEIPTQNKNYIWVDTFARWKISEPVTFLKTCISHQIAIGRIGDIINPAVKNAIAAYNLIESVRNTNREFDHEISKQKAVSGKVAAKAVDYKVEVGRSAIARQIYENAKVKLASFGIELLDVKIKRINYREDVRRSVYDRMIAERMQIVGRFRSEGQGEAQKIMGSKEKELKKITSEAYKRAQIVKGSADAKVTKIYADAYGKDPEFYSFVKSLDVYGETLDKESTVIMSTDSEFFKYINGRM